MKGNGENVMWQMTVLKSETSVPLPSVIFMLPENVQ
jgi:hypothetical protein